MNISASTKMDKRVNQSISAIHTATFESWVHQHAGDDARIVAVWVDSTPTPALLRGIAVRAIYAFDAPRVAGLRHWRDTVEVFDESVAVPGSAEPIAVHFVAHEAAKWARLVLKGHKPSASSLCGAKNHFIGGDLLSVRSLAELTKGPTFEPIEDWLQRVRSAATS